MNLRRNALTLFLLGAIAFVSGCVESSPDSHDAVGPDGGQPDMGLADMAEDASDTEGVDVAEMQSPDTAQQDLTCDCQPPAPTCNNGNGAVSYPVSCVDGQCVLGDPMVFYCGQGEVCANGVCGPPDNPCAGVTCHARPPR